MVKGEESRRPSWKELADIEAKEDLLPNYHFAQEAIEPRLAKTLIQDELMDEGNARQNLATFCQTYMEPEAVELMAGTLDKNAIDKSEYPRVTELENRCVNMLADLWNTTKKDDFLGTSTIGSSEACMLAGLAMKFSWRKKAERLSLDPAKKPNLIISSGYQVCWEKFSVYWDVELREIPMSENALRLDPAAAIKAIDEYTIGVVGILGITYTGAYDDIAKLNEYIERYNQQAKIPVSIHVDAASGGLYTPFVNPDYLWDFRLKNVVSINTSGHKYGLVYPGVGWIVWRDKAYLPEELIFKVSYLGGELPTMAINFSHSSAHIIGQYYNFLRYGFEGYRAIHLRTHKVAVYLSHELKKMAEIQLINDGKELPVICYTLTEEQQPKWTLYDLSDRLRMYGWQVPTYPLPKNVEQTIVQRIVIREDLGINRAQEFIEDLKQAIDDLNQAHVLFHDTEPPKSYGFTH